MSESSNLLKVSCAAIVLMFMSSLVPFELFAEDAKIKAARKDAFVNVVTTESFPVNEEKSVEKTEQKNNFKKTKKSAAKKIKKSREEKITISSKMISALNGGKVELGKASVEIPEEALSLDTEISISYLSKVQETGDSLTNVMINGCGYRFLPAGTKFNKKVTVSLPYDPVLNTKPQQLEDVYTYFYDTEKYEWIKLERIEIDRKNCVVKSYTTHFTDMINATLSLPESASPVDVNLNSIKNLEAAKPDSHIIKFNPPKADNTGDASFSFELQVPAGRRGMQPQVTVSYSSGGGNGIMGRNFDIRANSSITTDTRLGLPDYDLDDTYMLDGVKLSKSKDEESGSIKVITYTPLKQVNFEKIQRYYSEGDNTNYWLVTSKDGTKRYFGNPDSSEDNSCTGSKDKIFTWNLTKVVDVHKNTITYDYEKEDGYVYLKNIFYTGYETEYNSIKGECKVTFNYNEGKTSDDGKFTREDVRLDARSKSLVACKKILTSVETYNKEKILRKYKFEYKQGLAQDNRLVKLIVNNCSGKENDTYEYSFEYEGYRLSDGRTSNLFDEGINTAEIVYFSDGQKWDQSASSPLQTGKASSHGKNISGSAGVGYGSSSWDIRGTGGTSTSSSEGSCYSDSMLVDLNGDGRPDSLKKGENSGEFYVYFNTGSGFEENAYKILFPEAGENFNLNKEENDSSSTGWNVYGGAGCALPTVSANLGVSYAQTKQTSNSSSLVSFMDMDGDGLVDLLQANKETYLSNAGLWNSNSDAKPLFNKNDIYSNLPKIEIKPYISDTEIKDLQNSYYKLTPFRMWKATYSGNVRIVQNASVYTANDNNNTPITLFTLKDKGKVVDCEINKEAGFSRKFDSVLIKRKEHLYFISSYEEDIKNPTYDWNVKIDYTSVKAFDKELKIPYVYLPEEFSGLTDEDKCVFKTQKSIEEVEDYIFSEIKNSKNISNTDINWLFENIYEISVVNKIEKKELYSTEEEFIYSYTIGKRKNNTQALVDKGYFIPRYYTEESFNTLLKNVKTKYNSDADKIISFINSFSKSAVTDIYELKISEESIIDFNKDYFSIASADKLKNDALELYKIADCDYRFAGESVEFYKAKEYKEDASRDIENELKPGKISELKEDGEVVGKQIYIGDVFVDSKTKYKLGYNKYNENTKDGLFFYGNEDPKIFDAKYNEENESITVTYKINGSEDIVKISVRDPQYCAYTMSEVEMEEIVNDFMTDESINVPYSSYEDKHWFIEDKSKELIEGSYDEKNKNIPTDAIYINNLFIDENTGDALCFSVEEKEDFIKTAYGQLKEKLEFLSVDDYNELDASEKEEYEAVYNSSNKEVTYYKKVLYRYYTPLCFLSSADKDKLSAILNSYKRKRILTDENYFGFYEKKDSQYKLKENWKQEEINEGFADKNEDEDYLIKNERIKEYCKKYCIGKYMTANVDVIYSTNSEYNVVDDKKICILCPGEEDKNERVCTVLKELPALSFDSSDSILKDDDGYFVNKAKNNILYNKEITSNKDEKTIVLEVTEEQYNVLSDEEKNYYKYNKETHLYEKNITVAASDLDDAEEQYYVSNEEDEYLYGGYKGWFFGIWKGLLKNEDEIKFEEKLISSKNEASSRAESKKVSLNKNNENEVRFIIPDDYALLNLQNKEAQKLSDDAKEKLKCQLFGKIASSSEMVYPYFDFGSDSKTLKICSGRNGGNEYYTVLNRYRTEEKISFSISEEKEPYKLPSISKSHTEGTDITPSVNAGGTVNSGKITEIFNGLSNLSSGSLSGSWGTNKSESKVLQSIQDINADGIPDILTVTDNRLQVFYGKKNIENGCKIDYDSELTKTFDNIEALSVNKADVNVKGGSISPGGSSSATAKASGKIVVQMLASTNPSCGVSGSKGSNKQTAGLVDFNGDGLQDYYNGDDLKFNLGDKFEIKDGISFFTENIGESLSSGKNESLSVNFSLGTGPSLLEAKSLKTSASLNIGASYSVSSSNTEKMLLDINGDGLQDIVSLELPEKVENDEFNCSEVNVKYNTGCSFTENKTIILPKWKIEGNICNPETEFIVDDDLKNTPVIGNFFNDVAHELAKSSCNPYAKSFDKYVNSLDWSSTLTFGINGSAGANLNIGIKTGFGTVNITSSAGTGANGSTSINGAYVKMIDFDGDGMVDQVLRAGGATYWKKNLMGRVGLLRKINLPQGGSCCLDYGEILGTTDSPGHKYVLSEVTMNDGLEETGNDSAELKGCHSYTTKYEYENGYYNRLEKDFYGYGVVKTIFADNSMQKNVYYIDAYYSKGQVKESYFYNNKEDCADNYLTMTETILREAPKALVEKEVSVTREEDCNDSITTSTEYEYDDYGNVTVMTQKFPGSKELVCEVVYKNIEDKYIIGLAEAFTVKDHDDKILRYRTGLYNDYGQLTELCQYYEENNYTSTCLDYDNYYGNIVKVTDANGLSLNYTYDTNGMYVIKIEQSGTDSDAYTSSIEYDEVLQLKIKETDYNNNTLTYNYDDWQRLSKLFTSYDDEMPAVSYEYYTRHNGENKWYALTNNKVTFDHDDKTLMQTVVEIDGLGRAIRTAKTGYVYEKGEGWNVSGLIKYDNKGRSIEEGMTYFVSGELDAFLAFPAKMSDYSTKKQYDTRNRIIKTILPDESIQTTTYKIEVKDGLSYLVTDAVDPMENRTVTTSDAQGNMIYMEKYGKKGTGDSLQNELLTSFSYEYNMMGELLYANDAQAIDFLNKGIERHTVCVEYDMLGRKTAISSLDSGRQHFVYDKCSNIIEETNSQLEENGKAIYYEYDKFNHLIKIDYPGDETDVEYVYGKPDAEDGCAGKIVSVTDASGTLTYKYGKLGEVIEEDRKIYTHLGESDDIGYVRHRMSYKSDYLGRMQSITYSELVEDEEIDNSKNDVITYGYDKGGQVCSVKGLHYGEETIYIYNVAYDEYGQRVYIKYGNGVETKYTYDPARRWLDTIYTTNGVKELQNLKYSFDKNGNVSSYENKCKSSDFTVYDTSQKYSYDGLNQLISVEGCAVSNPYKSESPDFVSQYNQMFTFDYIGNMTSKISKISNSPNLTLGDDLNYSLDYVYDDTNYAHRLVRAGNRHYKYDKNGNVIMEKDGEFDSTDEENTYLISSVTEDVEKTEYAWGIYDINSAENNISATGEYYREYKWNSKNQLIYSKDSAGTCVDYVYGQDGQRTNKYVKASGSETIYFNKMYLYRKDSGNAFNGGQIIVNIYLGDTRIATKLNSATSPTLDEEREKLYYYHSDHLGSATLITKKDGDIYQKIEYTPYGETWIEKTENTGLEYLPYKFTAQEKDSETGLYYYGARYLDPKYSRWISTDPALGEYIPIASTNDKAKEKNGNLPGMGGIYNHINSSLYHYAGNNPVRYVDPDGNEIINTNVWYAREFMQDYGNVTWPNSNDKISLTGCTLIAANRVANVAIYEFGNCMDTPIASSAFNMLNNSSVTNSNGMIFSGIEDYLSAYGVDVTVTDTGKMGSKVGTIIENAANSEEKFFLIGRILGKDGDESHFVNINGYDSVNKKAIASDTSRLPTGEERRDLRAIDPEIFDRIIKIEVKVIEEK